MRKITLLSVMLLFVSHFSIAQDSFKRVSIENLNQNQINILVENGIDFRCGAIHNHNSVELELSENDLQILKNNGIGYTVKINNLSDFYSQRGIENLPKAKAELEIEKSKTGSQRASISNVILDNQLQYTGCSEVDWAVPSNFNLGSMGGCLTISEVIQELDDMNTYDSTNSLDIVSVKQDASPTGQTTWGNPSGTITNNGQSYTGQGTSRWNPQTIQYVRITGNESSTAEGTKPQMLFTSMIHSREVSALMSNIYFMWYLIENYNTDPAVKHLVDNNELYFIPVVNPDGLRWNEHLSSSGGGMQRKNLRPNTGSTSNSTNLRGVDLNRNFDYFWGSAGTGSSGNPSLDTYRGPSAASEPETQIIVDFVLARNFETALWNHTYANVIPHPYGGNPSFVSGREDEMHKMHEDMTKYNRYVFGATVFTPANGIADDWMVGGAEDGNGSYGMDGHTSGSGREILATTPEHGGSSFWPNPSLITPEAKRSVRISFMNAYYGGKYAKFHDLTQSDVNSLTSDLTFGIERIGQTASDFTITVTPISSNIAGITSPIVESGMTILEQRNATATLTLNAGIQPNDKIEYNVKLSNDDAIFYDINIEKYYQPSVLFTDNPDVNGISNWTATGGWITTTTDAYSNTTSIKDGNTIPYANNSTKTLTTANTFDFSGATEILVQFYTKWDMERNFDFVEILGSTDGSNWQPLCGNYTKPESSSSTNDHAAKGFSDEAFQGNQSSGQVYDGDRMDKWVMEEILIDASNNSFLNGATTAQFRFNFRSDSENESENYSTTSDGFFFDDFKIISVQIPCATDVPTGITVSNSTPTSADINWDNIPSATYDVRYRAIGAPSWIEVTDIATNNYSITGLTAPEDYEVQVRTRCTSTTSAYSVSTNFSIVPCSGSVVDTYPYLETFNNSGTILWTQGTGDDGSWTLDANGTPTTTSGPSGDFDSSNPTVNGSGNYFYTEASSGEDPGPSSTVYLESPCFDLSDFENSSFSFYYHMYGGDMGNLVLEISNDDGITWNLLETITGQQQASSGAVWLQHTENISTYDGEVVKLRFTGNTGTNFASDISIDEINLLASPVTLGIDSNQFSDITIYPNPFSSSLTVKIPQEFQGSNLNFELIDLSGRSIYSFTKDNVSSEIMLDELSQLSNGSYFIKITGSNINNIIFKQIIKK